MSSMSTHYVQPIVSDRWRDCVAMPASKAVPAWESFIALVDVCSVGLDKDDIELAVNDGLIAEARRRIQALAPKEPS